MSTNTKLADALRRELRRRKVHSLPAKLRLMAELGLDDIALTQQWMIDAARDFEAAATEFLAAQDAEQAAQAVPAYTEGHCKEKAKPGGCQLHNLQCGYPECDRKAAPAAPAPEAQAVPAGWRIQRNADGSIGLFAPPPKDGESRRTSECFTGRIGNDKEEIVFKLLDRILKAAAPAPEAQPEPDDRARAAAIAAEHILQEDYGVSLPPQAQAAGHDELMSGHFKTHINTYADKHPTLLVRQLASALREQLAAALAQRQSLTEWQPIETAPKDGSHVVGWMGGKVGYLVPMFWDKDCYCWRHLWNHASLWTPNVTHWMPPLAAPGATTGEQQP